MASLPVLTSVVRVQARPLAFWSLALAGVTTMYAGLYPFIGEIDMEAMLEDLPEGMVDALGYDEIGSAAGYLSSSVFGLLGPILLLVFGIGLGARLLAGVEEDGSIELELTSPISRTRIYLERLFALALGVTQLVVVVLVVLAVINQVADLGIAAGSILSMCLSFWVFALAFASLSFAIGAATGRRSLAVGIPSALALVSFMVNAIGPAVGLDWLTLFSPWSWYIKDSPLLHDLRYGRLFLLFAFGAIPAVWGLVRFRVRDLMV